MSFFDDEQTETGTSDLGQYRPSGGGRNPDQRSVMSRRLIAGGVAAVVVLLLAVLIKGCLDDRASSQIKEFNGKTAQLISDSDTQVSAPLFKKLQGAASKPPTDIQDSVNQLGYVAADQVKLAQKLDAPDDLKSAKSNLVQTMKLREDGVKGIAANLQTAISRNSGDSQRAVDAIAGQMRAFDASDVIYSLYVAPAISKALDNAGIAVGAGGEKIAQTNFLPDIKWLDPSYVSSQLAGSSSPAGAAAPGTHGHSLDSVSAGGQQLSTDTTNSVPGSPPPAFAVTFTNGGSVDESNVTITVKVEGGPSPITATKVVARTAAGQQQTVQVPLASAPPIGQTVTVTVTIGVVPGESNGDNNTQSFQVSFT